jgi:signal transduction histidine kinase
MGRYPDPTFGRRDKTCDRADNRAVSRSNREPAVKTYAPAGGTLSDDPDVLRTALSRESSQRRRADSIARMQTDVVNLVIDLVVHDFDVEKLFGGLTKKMVEQTGSHVCAIWLLDDEQQRCDMRMAYIVDRFYTRDSTGWQGLAFPHESLGRHLIGYKPGWARTIKYRSGDPRLPDAVRQFDRRVSVNGMIVAPLRIGGRTLGWIKLSGRGTRENEDLEWSRVVLIEAIARQAALALHHSRVFEQSRLEERRKSILEERNRLARDIHDNLAQGFAAILMQLQATQRDCRPADAVANKLETAIALARAHLGEARRSVLALRPNLSDSEVH